MKEIYKIFLELISKKSDGTFGSYQSHLVDKISNHDRLTVYTSLKSERLPLKNYYFIKINIV